MASNGRFWKPRLAAAGRFGAFTVGLDAAMTSHWRARSLRHSGVASAQGAAIQ